MRIHWSILLASEFCAVLAGSLYFIKIKTGFLFLYIYVLLGFLTETWNVIYIKLGTSSNLWGSHIYFPLEFLLLALFYIPYLEPVLKRKWMVSIIVLFIAYCILNVAFLQDVHERSNVRAFSSIMLVAFSILYFYRIMIESKIRRLATEPMVWMNSAILLFFTSILFYNALFNPALHISLQLARFMATINQVLIAIFYLFIAYTFYLEGKNKTI